jgi:hypothetical protein
MLHKRGSRLFTDLAQARGEARLPRLMSAVERTRLRGLPLRPRSHHSVRALVSSVQAQSARLVGDDERPEGASVAEIGQRLGLLCQDNPMAGERGRGWADGMAEISDRRHRLPSVVIQHPVWLYLRFLTIFDRFQLSWSSLIGVRR